MTEMVTILIYDRMGLLDFSGPFAVFSIASRLRANTQPAASALFEVVTIAEFDHTVRSRGGMGIAPHFTLESHPQTDILIIPGGFLDAVLDKPKIIEWIAESASSAKITASITTGAFLLAKAGLLDGKTVTTSAEDAGLLQAQYPKVRVRSGVRYVDSGNIVTAGGIAAGLDMSLHLVRRLAGEALAVETARYMDYPWSP
jgi:transcriptional regulator GlxA family with amidase domain